MIKAQNGDETISLPWLNYTFC